MPYDETAIDVLREMQPARRRWMTPGEAADLAKSCGYLVDPPPMNEESEYKRVSLLFDSERGAPSAIEMWIPQPRGGDLI